MAGTWRMLQSIDWKSYQEKRIKGGKNIYVATLARFGWI